MDYSIVSRSARRIPVIEFRSSFEGYFLRIKDEVRPELVSPPPTTRRFRILFEGESVYVPTDSRLEPDIPFSEFQKIFDPQVGTSMIFGKKRKILALTSLMMFVLMSFKVL